MGSNGFYELKLMRFHETYSVCALEGTFENDNDSACTGRTHQMPAVKKHLRQWLKQQNKNGKGKGKGKEKYRGNAKVSALVNKVNARRRVMQRNKQFKGSAFERMVTVLFQEMNA